MFALKMPRFRARVREAAPAPRNDSVGQPRNDAARAAPPKTPACFFRPLLQIGAIRFSVTPVYETPGMSQLKVHVGDFKFEEEDAPKTVAAFKKAMPFVSQAIHVRWSGEGVWMPLGDLDFGVDYENHTSFPAPGHIILYPGGISETEILLAYSGVSFASKMGQLAGNHFITITSNLDKLKEMGKTVLWKGAQDVRFEMV
jgi:hypothetical protein